MAHSAQPPAHSLVSKAAITLLALTLTGCSTPADGAPVPPTTLPSPAAPTPAAPLPTTAEAEEPSTPTPTSARPVVPAEATWEVVEEFFAAYTEGLTTGDASRLEELSTKACGSCANLVRDILQLETRGIVGTGGTISFQSARELKSLTEGRFVWRVDYTQAPIRFTYPNPEDSYTTDPLTAVFYIELTQEKGSWRISGISDKTGHG